MIPPSNQFRCNFHFNQNVFMVDLSPQKVGNSRALCPICLQENPNRQIMLTIEEFEAQVISFGLQKEQEIRGKHELENQKLQNICKQLATLKEKVIKEFNNMIQNVENIQGNIKGLITEEQKQLRDLGKNMGLTKLEEVAEILSQKQFHSILNTMNDISEQLTQSITNTFNQLDSCFKEHLQKLIKSLNTFSIPTKNPKIKIITSKVENNQTASSDIENKFLSEEDQIMRVVENASKQDYVAKSQSACKVAVIDQIDCPQECFILTSHPFQRIIVGGIRCVIMIWEQRDIKLVKTAVLAMHTDVVTGVAIFDSGDQLISCGLDGQIIIWKQCNQAWKQVSLIKKLNYAFTYLKLAPNQKQVLATCNDNYIRTFLINSKNQLQSNQEIQQGHLIFSFSVNQKQDLLAISTKQKYFKVYYASQNGWIFQGKLITEGEVHRVHFTNDFELICQQSVVPALHIYRIYKGKGYMIERIHRINLPESDDSCINFPIFQINDFYCVKNGKTLYLIKQYKIEHEIYGNFEAGCCDTQNQFLILKDSKSLQLCSFN